jgi:hypothetical protein
VVVAFFEFSPALKKALDYEENVKGTFLGGELLPLIIFAGLVVTLAFVGLRRGDQTK